MLVVNFYKINYKIPPLFLGREIEKNEKGHFEILLLRDDEKRFYNRETNSAAFCVILQISINPNFPPMKLQ